MGDFGLTFANSSMTLKYSAVRVTASQEVALGSVLNDGVPRKSLLHVPDFRFSDCSCLLVIERFRKMSFGQNDPQLVQS